MVKSGGWIDTKSRNKEDDQADSLPWLHQHEKASRENVEWPCVLCSKGTILGSDADYETVLPQTNDPNTLSMFFWSHQPIILIVFLVTAVPVDICSAFSLIDSCNTQCFTKTRTIFLVHILATFQPEELPPRKIILDICGIFNILVPYRGKNKAGGMSKIPSALILPFGSSLPFKFLCTKTAYLVDPLDY